MAQEHPLQLGSSCVDKAKNGVDCFVHGCTPEHPIVKRSESISHKTITDVGMVPRVSEEHVCLHRKTNWWKNSRNKKWSPTV